MYIYANSGQNNLMLMIIYIREKNLVSRQRARAGKHDIA